MDNINNMKYCSQFAKNKVKEEFEKRQEELIQENLLHQIEEAYETPDGRNKVLIFKNRYTISIPYLELLKYHKLYSLGFFDLDKNEEIYEQNKKYSLLKYLEQNKDLSSNNIKEKK